ncbi:MAG: hypothetical protein N2652_11400 [Kiritimatiellae bacterium]|nr:hypothetical protein [Kiritimatiellia bacterium]
MNLKVRSVLSYCFSLRRLTVLLSLAGFGMAQAALRTWTGSGDMQWSQPDSTSWDATYVAGDDVLFSGAGLGTIEILGTVNPATLRFTHGSGMYIFTNTAASLHASGGFTNASGGIVQFGNMQNQPLLGLSWTGATLIANGSELRLTRATSVGVSTSIVHLSGGIISFGADNSVAYLVPNPVVVGAAGGTIRVQYTANQTRYNFTNAISGSGPLTLMSWGNPGAGANAGLQLAGNNSGFFGPVTIVYTGMVTPVAATTRPTVTWFTNATAMFPNASGITVRDGGTLGVEFGLTDALLANVKLGPRGGLAARGDAGTLTAVTAPMARIPAGGMLFLDNFQNAVNNRYPDAAPLAMTNNQLAINGRNAASSPIDEVVGAMSVVGGAHVLLRRQNGSGSGVVLSPASLATPNPGSSLLIETDALSSPALGESASLNSIAIQTGGARPAVTNGMLPPSIQTYEGGNALGHFVTYGATVTNRIVPATYTSTDINTAGPTDLVNIGASAQTLTSSKTIYALRLGQALTLNPGVTLTIGSGGLLLTSQTIQGDGTLNFGNVPAYIGAYNAAAQAHLRSKITGTAGLVIMGTSQTLNITNIFNTFTGGIWINGGAARFHFNAANGNDVVVNAYGRLIAGGTANSMDTIGGLSGAGAVSAWIAGSGISTGMLVVAPGSGTYQFEGAMTDGAAGRVMGLIKSGAGTQILGTNFVGLYSGFTVVSGGVLQVDGSLAGSPAVAVVNGGRLQGTGLIGGHLLAADANSTLAPGASPGTLTVTGNVTMASGTIFEAEILGPLAGQYDVLAMQSTSTLTLGGATLSVISPTPLPLLTVFPIISGWGTIDTSTFSGMPDGTVFTAGANQFQINYGTLSGYANSVTLTVVPEPGTLTVPGLIGLLLILRRRLR